MRIAVAIIGLILFALLVLEVAVSRFLPHPVPAVQSEQRTLRGFK